MVTAKAIAIAKEIETARCKSNWQVIPELARRYKKHNPTGIVLEQSILAENELNKATDRSESLKRIYQSDSPESITLSTRLDPESIKHIKQKLAIALGDKDPSSETQLLKKALSVKAMSMDLLERLKESIEGYQHLIGVINQYPNLIDRAIVDWCEEALYRGSLLALSQRCEGMVSTEKMNFIRAYQKIGSSQTTQWNISKRIIVTQHSVRYLSSLYRQQLYQPPIDFSQTDEGKQQLSTEGYEQAKASYDHQLFSIEIMQLYTVYEKLVYGQTHFPTSGTTNTIVLDFINQFTSDFRLVGPTEADWRGMVDVLNRAALKTFNSSCIARHLFLALYELGEYGEAEHALRSYLDLIGLEKLQREVGPALAIDPQGIASPIPIELQEVELVGSETAQEIVEVLSTAVKVFVRDLAKGSEAVHVAELAHAVYQKDSDPALGGLVYRTLGIAYGFLATQTFDPEYRPRYHEKALDYLKKSIELDSENWVNHYELALQLAEIRDIGQSLQAVTRSLQLNSLHLPSWHLLTLLCTCPVKNNLSQALKTCETTIASRGLQETHWVDFNPEIAELISFQMTHTLLAGRLEGSEAALVLQQDLFSIFSKIMIPELIPEITFSSDLSKPARSRSNSSFTGRKLHLAEVFHHHSESSSVVSSPTPKGSKLSLLDPKSFIRKNRKESIDDQSRMIKREQSDGSMASTYTSQSGMSNQTLIQSNTVAHRPTTRARLNHQRSCRILCDLWLLSAKGFLKAGKLEEALKAASEAENVDWTSHAAVWSVLGRIYLEKKQFDLAIKALQKGLVTEPNDVECRVWLAKTYIDQGHLELAEGILENLTEQNGWNNPIAWFYLAEIYKATDRLERTKDCLFYALELENTTPIQPFSILPRFV